MTKSCLIDPPQSGQSRGDPFRGHPKTHFRSDLSSRFRDMAISNFNKKFLAGVSRRFLTRQLSYKTLFEGQRCRINRYTAPLHGTQRLPIRKTCRTLLPRKALSDRRFLNFKIPTWSQERGLGHRLSKFDRRPPESALKTRQKCGKITKIPSLPLHLAPSKS